MSKPKTLVLTAAEKKEMTPFTRRLFEHPLIEFAAPYDKGGVMAVKNQLLVAASKDGSVQGNVLLKLSKLGFTSAEVTRLATLRQAGPFSPNAPLPAPNVPAGQPDDVQILEITFKKSTGIDNVYALTSALRALLGTGEKQYVSPNHILTPAWNGDNCPYGPPMPVAYEPVPAPLGNQPGVAVTVIDSGWYWDSAWKGNPLANHAKYRVVQAERHKVASAPTWKRIDVAGLTSFHGWKRGIPDVLSHTDPGNKHPDTLDSLVGHANFVSGVVAQTVDFPTIAVWNHNGSYASPLLHPPIPPQLTTEAAVCRSIINSHTLTPAPVISVGFAFPAFGDVLSTAWNIVFGVIGQDDSAPRLVAPAGNGHPDDLLHQEDLRVPRYPAAFGDPTNPTFKNVIGVASFDHTASSVPSTFSFRGNWVASSSIGAEVASTFLRVQAKVEDDPEPPPRRVPRDFTRNAWAAWNGTSFATPKVSAAIAAAYMAGGNNATPAAAWKGVMQMGRQDPNNLLGVMLPDLC